MLAAVTAALSTVIGWVGTVVTSLVTEAGQLNELLPLFAVGIAVSALMLGIAGIRKVTWGA